ncbi:MAG: chain-length determining protein [Bacteroidales bacterium]|nr:chain-length determining protein [Bacteroidales bacterium]
MCSDNKYIGGMEEQNVKKPLLKEADLLQLVGKVLAKWKFILKVTICSMLLGLVMALTMIKGYTAQVVVAPESSNSSMMSGGLGSLASMVGFDLGSVGGDDAIYPLLYPDIVQSLPFLSSLFDVNVKSQDGMVDTTYFYYIDKLQKKNWVGVLKNAPKKAVKGLMRLFSSKKMQGDPAVFNPYNLSERQMRMIENLNGAISIFVDKKTNVITLSFTDQDPLIAAIMVDTIMCRLQDQITAYRTKKVVDDCAYIEKLYQKSKADYEKAQETYASYVDRNRNVTQERFLVEKERLEADKDLKNMLYTQWAQQLMLAQAKVQEYTPVFVTLKPAAVPALPSTMRRSMVLILYTFFGGVLAVAYVLLKEPFVNVYRKLFKSKK